MFHYSPNSLPCFLPLLTDCHILIKAMHCKGKVLQGALFQQAQYRAAKCPHPFLTFEGSSCFGRQAECCPHGEAERAPLPPPGCRQNEAPYRTEGSLRGHRWASSLARFFALFFSFLFRLFAFLFFFTPFHLSYTDTLILPQFHPLPWLRKRSREWWEACLKLGDERD